MPSETIPQLLSALDYVVLLEQADGRFRVVARVPKWFLEICPEAKLDRPIRIEASILFLEEFLIDAREAWERGDPAQIQSGPWTEVDASGSELILRATAIALESERFLLVHRLREEFEEMRAVLQKARENSLQSYRLEQVAEALRENSAETRALLESMPDVMFRLRRDGSYLDFSHSERIGGAAAPAQLRTKRVDEALTPELAHRFMRHVEKALDIKSVQLFEYQRWVEGDERDFEARLALCGDDEVLAIVRDITERKRNEAELANLLELIRSNRDDILLVLNQLHIGAVLTDEVGCCTFLSQPAQRLFGMTQDEVLGVRWDELEIFRASDRMKLKRISKQPRSLRSRIPIHWQRADGKQYWMEVDIQDDPRKPQRKILFFYDVSEVHSLRRMLGDQGHPENIVGKSKPMQQVYRLIQDLAMVDATVLIEGETGTGKELVARAIHSSSHRQKGPFLALNCAGLTESLVASQLFGHRRGSFTGAVQDQRGLFEVADGGVLFLDEIGDIPLNVQTSLLRVLQEREITRVGESRPRKVDVRILSATHHNLTEEVAAGNFRADLVYRIRVARIQIPPLRERVEDIPLLVARFVEEFRAATGKPIRQVSTEAMRKLTDYHWPGNVRELKSAVEFAGIRSRRSVILPEDLPPEVLGFLEVRPMGEQDEKSRLLEALKRANGNRTQAARILGIGRATLYRQMAALKIPKGL